MSPSEDENSEVREIKILLQGIVSELKIVGTNLSRQCESTNSIAELGASPDHLALHDFIVQFGRSNASSGGQRAIPVTSAQELSKRTRCGPLLTEALKRYQTNSVPYWNTLYGTHLKAEDHPEIPEEVVRNSEWTSITGDCWKIPHDNRVSFCFQAPLSDPKIVVQVRNFLSTFHRRDGEPPNNGKHFNIWDWFDTGISAYWCPGNREPEILQNIVYVAGADTLNDNSGMMLNLSHLVAPWRRIINLQGLTTLSNCDKTVLQEDLSPSDLCPFLCSDLADSIFHQPVSELIWRTVKLHLSCQRVPDVQHAELRVKDCLMFHITFFEILAPGEEMTMLELWPCGDLHSDGQALGEKPRQLRESSLTIFAAPSTGLPGPILRSAFWTMICLRPSQFPHLDYFENIDDLARGNSHEMLDEISNTVHKGLLAVVRRWEEIAEYFDQILSEKKGLLSPEYHDSLLIDDESFSRSKKYFWAIRFLEEVGHSLSDNIAQLKRFLELMKSTPPTVTATGRDLQMGIKRHCITMQKMQLLKTRFQDKKKEAMALRDGLFSASAVIESRASTQLGENVRLLTFLSIFFLPLTFCTSLWSISNNIFHVSALAVVMPIVSITTYIIVLNLNNIASLMRPSRMPFIQKIIAAQVDDMRNDTDIVWKERGLSFSNLGAARGDRGRPSRWRLLQFAARKTFRKDRAFGSLQVMSRAWQRGIGIFNASERRRPPVSLGNLGDIRVKVQVDIEEGSNSLGDL